MGIALTLLISIFSAVSIVLQLDANGLLLMQIIPFFISAILFTIYMKKKDPSLKEFGFYKPKISKMICFFIVICIFVQPLILGIDFSLSFSIVFLIIVQMFLVGYTEEVLFRSIFYYELKKRDNSICCIFEYYVWYFTFSNSFKSRVITCFYPFTSYKCFASGICFFLLIPSNSEYLPKYYFSFVI